MNCRFNDFSICGVSFLTSKSLSSDMVVISDPNYTFASWKQRKGGEADRDKISFIRIGR